MNPIVKNVIAVIAGIAVGTIVNMGLIILGGNLIPLPEGIDTGDMESLAENIHLFTPKHFIAPYIAHALGTLTGAYTAARFGGSNYKWLGLGIGAWFFVMGTIMVFMMPITPVWFNALDLLTYLPMGWLGWKLSKQG